MFLKTRVLVVTLLGFLVHDVVSVPSAQKESKDALDGYTIVPLTVKGRLIAGGPELNFTGSVPEIVKQIEVHGGPAAFQTDTLANIIGVKNRIFPVDCNVPSNYGPAEVPGIEYGTTGLENLAAFRCSVPAGPRVCTELYCGQHVPSMSGGIWLCNDQTVEIQPSCAYLAGYASNIINACQAGSATVNGQQFDTDRYNVLVRGGIDC